MPIPTAYFAGLFDGEGCVRVARERVRSGMPLNVTISNNNRAVLDRVQEVFGGGITVPSTGTIAGPQKGAWTWSAYGREATDFLRTIEPYAIIKRPQIKVALTYPHGALGRRVSERTQAKRVAIYNELRLLKTKVRTPYAPDTRATATLAEKMRSRSDVKRAIELYRSGKSVHEVAKAMRKKDSTVSYWLTTLGETRGRKEAQSLRWRADPLAERPPVKRAIALYRTGLSGWAVARKMGIAAATVSYWLRELGETRSLEAAQALRWNRETNP